MFKESEVYCKAIEEKIKNKVLVYKMDIIKGKLCITPRLVKGEESTQAVSE